ncbi:MAG: glycosyltransferase family 9 protein [Pirellulales bacterium]|nr:glycosyltransferase family 9 protein [Pirellulales bacterium]
MPPTWTHARRLLCIRLDALGDVLMTEPALRALRQSAPNRSVTLLTSPAGAEAAALLPGVDDVLVYEAPWMKAAPLRRHSRPDRAFLQRLRRLRFDGAVIFTVYSQPPLPAAMLCYWADIPLRLAHCRENPYQLLTDWIPDPEPHEGVRHEVQRQLDLVGAIDAKIDDDRIRLAASSDDVDAATALLEQTGVDPGAPWLVIHPGASAPSRRWPAELFAEAADELARAAELQIVFTGARHEKPLIDGIRSQMQRPSFSLCGQLNVPRLAGLLARAPLLIANNTGPVHLAAGVGTPVVDLYALTNPQHTPWGVPARVLSFDVPCKFCYRSVCPEGHHDCLRRVTPLQVVGAALELLAVAPARAAPRTESAATTLHHRPNDASRSSLAQAAAVLP